MLRTLDRIEGVPEDATVVLDLFTIRTRSTNLTYNPTLLAGVDQDMLEKINNTPILTTKIDNIEQCAGPVFALRIRDLKRET